MTVLVSQPKPQDENSQYYRIEERYPVKFDFRPFIEVVPVELKDFKAQKIKILDHTAVIFVSRYGIDYFFSLCTELKIEIPATMKYFCISEQMANYLQKYITVRKRKTFCGNRTSQELLDIIKKHPKEKYIFPCSETSSRDIYDFLKTNEYTYTPAIVHKTIASDLSDLADVNYDMLAFFSPSGVKSLFTNFPKFKQKNTLIAGFGTSTCQAIEDNDLTLNIEAPLPEAPSMIGAIELYLKSIK
ncbi:MAG: uroporphyrinogen-III synthase [Reichenbachiella sp.]